MYLQGSQARLAQPLMGTRWAMGHGGRAQYIGSFDRKGKSEGPRRRRPLLTPTQQGVSLLQGHQSHAPPMATHIAAFLGLNSVVRAHMVTSVLVSVSVLSLTN